MAFDEPQYGLPPAIMISTSVNSEGSWLNIAMVDSILFEELLLGNSRVRTSTSVLFTENQDLRRNDLVNLEHKHPLIRVFSNC